MAQERKDRSTQEQDPSSAPAPVRSVAPGRVTLTGKLSDGTAPARQRRPIGPPPGPAPVQRTAARDAEIDRWMDAAHRGVTALVDSGQQAVQLSPAPPGPAAPAASSAAPAASPAAPAASSAAPGVTIDPPQPGIDKPGFIDNDDGANIRTRPAELQGATLTPAPLPPATRVFVSGQHPEAPGWWYVTAFLPGAIVRGYVQGFRVTTDLPEPTAKLYQIQPGDTAERLAVQEFSAAVRDGHDLRYYENVLLAVNRTRGRAGVTGTFQDPGILGGGANNVQLEAGRRIWLVSPAYARSLEAEVPDGSLTGGMAARARRVLGHIDDLVQSVTDSPRHFGAVAGEYADAIKDHLPEIIGITAGFILAESASAFLAATPTGVGQLAAAVIQLGLATFGATIAVDACGQARQHAEQWLAHAWTAHGDTDKLAAASQEFLKTLVSIAMAALAIAGVRGNVGKGLKIADAIKFQPPTLGWSAMATADGAAVTGGPVFTPGSITSAGPVDIGPSLMSATGAGASKVEGKEAGNAGTEHASKPSRADESATTEATKQHVHEGGKVTDIQSPYYGRWDGSGIHSWEALLQRCKADGFEIVEVKLDPATGARRATIERVGMDPKTGRVVKGRFKKTIYPKKMSPAEIDAAAESALQQAVSRERSTMLEPFGTKQRKDGGPADGYFEATVTGPDGVPLRIQGWFKESAAGRKEITSHAPRYDEAWPVATKETW